MSGLVVALLLTAAMSLMMSIAVRHRPRSRPVAQMPGELSVAERKHLYRRLGIDPEALRSQGPAKVIWADPRVIDTRRTEA
jgi:hypothetical protein